MRVTRTILSVTVAGLLSVVAVPVAWADTITVCWDGSGDYLTIQEGIDAAVDNDEVVICPGTYTGDGNRDLDYGGKAITVRSTDPEDPAVVASTVIDCQGSSVDEHRGFLFYSGETALSVLAGLTVKGGYASRGGAVICYSNPRIENCVFSNNSAIRGGGICLHYGNPTLINCIFTRNYAPYGYGGGIYIYRTSIYPLRLTNCIFNGNSALRGGGMYNERRAAELINCTLTANSALIGGGIYNYGFPIKIYNCIVWNTSLVGAHYVYYSDIQGGWPGPGNIDTDPLFVDPDGPDDIVGTEDDDLHLLFNSPCIDAGNNYYVVEATDLDGKPRIIDGDGNGYARVDMGAYEFQLCALSLLLDILPSDDQNLFVPNKKSSGRIPMAILGSEELAATDIDPASIKIAAAISPIKTSTDKDVNGDGLVDLVMHFSRRDLIDALFLDTYEVGEVVDVTVTAALEGDGCTIVATDNIVIMGPED